MGHKISVYNTNLMRGKMKGGINLIENTSTGNDTLEMVSAAVF